MWQVVITCMGLSIAHMVLSNPSAFRFFPHFWTTGLAGGEFDAYVTLKAQAATFYQDLGFSHFDGSRYEPLGHLAKMRFRLFLPFLVATLGLTLWLMQLLLSGAFIWVATAFTQRIVQDRPSTLLFMLGFSLLYPVRSAWLDITAYGDFFAYFFLLLAVYVNRPWLVFLTLQLAFWTDERALVNAAWVLLWYGLDTAYRTGHYKVTGSQMAVVFSGLVYGVLRLLIARSVNHSFVDTASAYASEFRFTYYENIKIVGFRLWSGFLGEWGLISLALVLLLYRRQYVLLVLFAGMLCLTVNLSFVVFDTNRAISYGYLAIFVALGVLVRNLSVTELRRLLLFTFLYMLLCPLPNRLRLPGGYTIM